MLLPCNVSMRALVLCQRDDALTSQLDSFVESLRACVPAQRRRRSLGASARRATASSMVASARHDESVSSLNSGYRGRCSNPLPVGRLSVEAVAAQQNKPAPRHVREEAVAPRRWTRTASIVAGLLRDSQGLWRLAFAHCTDRLPASTLRVSGGAEAMGSARGDLEQRLDRWWLEAIQHRPAEFNGRSQPLLPSEGQTATLAAS
jgi:hypothetical protein